MHKTQDFDRILAWQMEKGLWNEITISFSEFLVMYPTSPTKASFFIKRFSPYWNITQPNLTIKIYIIPCRKCESADSSLCLVIEQFPVINLFCLE